MIYPRCDQFVMLYQVPGKYKEARIDFSNFQLKNLKKRREKAGGATKVFVLCCGPVW